MSRELDVKLEHLRSLSLTVHELRDLLNNVEDRRAELMRTLRDDGYGPTLLAKVAQISRSRAYQIFDEPGPLADDEAYAVLAEKLDEAWQIAVDRWEAASHEGTPDDFFPLEALLARQ